MQLAYAMMMFFDGKQITYLHCHICIGWVERGHATHQNPWGPIALTPLWCDL